MEPQTVFNNFDYIVIGVVLLSALLALMRGFVRELFSLVAWVGAYFIAINFYEPAIPFAHRYVKSDQVAEWTAMGIVFVITLILFMIVGYFVCGLVKGKVLTTIDRSLGFLYGLARGALVICLVYMGATMLFWDDIDAPASKQQQENGENGENKETKGHYEPPEYLLKAKTRPLMSAGAELLKPLLPEELLDKEKLKKEMKNIEKITSDEETSSDEEKKGPIDIDKLFKGGKSDQ
jgi:membrane protein required for colicin V production